MNTKKKKKRERSYDSLFIHLLTLGSRKKIFFKIVSQSKVRIKMIKMEDHKDDEEKKYKVVKDKDDMQK